MARRGEAARFPIAVVGAGALGTLFARRLSRVAPTALIGRNPGVLPQADWVVVLVKAYDTAAALRTARRMRAEGIVSLQNGLIEAITVLGFPTNQCAIHVKDYQHANLRFTSSQSPRTRHPGCSSLRAIRCAG